MILFGAIVACLYVICGLFYTHKRGWTDDVWLNVKLACYGGICWSIFIVVDWWSNRNDDVYAQVKR